MLPNWEEEAKDWNPFETAEPHEDDPKEKKPRLKKKDEYQGYKDWDPYTAN